MFEYMACAKPVIVGIAGDAKNLVESTMSGKVVSPENKNELSKAILYYYENPNMVKSHGENGRSYVLNNMVKRDLVLKCLEKIRNYR
jgi:glycosyltransferase involved in cell wall biosynthesis